MAEPFGAKVKLTVNKTGQGEFKKEIQQVVDSGTYKIKNIQIKPEGGYSKLRKQIQEGINSLQTPLVIKINKFDASPAIADLRKQLTAMLANLRITGVSDLANNTKTSSATSTKKNNTTIPTDSNIDKTIEKGKQKIAELNASFDLLKRTMTSLKSEYMKTTSGKNELTDVDHIQDVKKKYDDLTVSFEKLNNAKKNHENISVADVQDLTSQSNELKKIISAYTEEETVMKRVKTLNDQIKTAISKCTPEAEHFKDEYQRLLNELNSGSLNQDQLASISKRFSSTNSNYNRNTDDSQYKTNMTSAINLLKQIETFIKKDTVAAGDFNNELNKIKSSLQTAVDNKFIKTSDYTKLSEEFARIRLQAVQTQTALNNMADGTKVSNKILAIETYFKRNTRAAKQFNAEYQEMLALLKSGKITNNEFNKVSKQFVDIKEQVKSFGIEGRTALESVKHAFSQFGGWSLVTSSLMTATMAVKDMFTAVKELDSALGDLKIITNETSETYSNFMKQVSGVSQNVGSSMTDILSSSTDWARLGYSLDDSLDLSGITAQYSRVAGTQIEDATSAMVSALQAFNTEGMSSVELAQRIADEFALVGNSFPIDAEGIGEGMKRGAAALVSANNSLEESIALITAGNLITQDPDATGTTLKTVSARIRGAKAELEELGEDVSDLAPSSAKLQEDIKGLTGVDIMLDANTFKSTYQILKEISEVWSNISDVSQAAVIEELAGKRNISAVTSIIENFDLAEDALNTALGADGTVTSANEEYLATITGKLEQLSAAFENLSYTVINSDLVGSAVDGATEFLNALSKIVDTLGTLPTLIGVISAALTALKIDSIISPISADTLKAGNNPISNLVSDNKIFENIKKGVTSGADVNDLWADNKDNISSKSMQTRMQSLLGIKDAADNATEAETKLARATNQTNANANVAKIGHSSLTKTIIAEKAATVGATVAATAFNAAISMGVTALITLGIMGIAKAVGYLTDKYKEATDAAYQAQKAQEALQNTTTQIDELEQKISGNKDTISSLEGDTSLAAVNKASALREQNAAYEEQKRLLEDIAKEQQTASDNATVKEITERKISVDLSEKEAFDLSGGTTTHMKSFDTYAGAIEREIEQYNNRVDEINSTLSEDVRSELEAKNRETLESIRSLYVEYSGDYAEIANIDTPDANAYKQTFQSISQEFNDLLKTTSNATATITSDLKLLESAFNEFSTNGTLTDTTLSSTNSIMGQLSSYAEFEKLASSGKATTEEFSAALSGLTQEYLLAQVAVGNFNNATEEEIDSLLSEAGVLNSGAVATKVYNYAQAQAKLAAFDFAEGTYASETALYSELEALGLTQSEISRLASLYASAQSSMSQALASNAQSRIQITQQELVAIKTIADAYAKVAGLSASDAASMTNTELVRHANGVTGVKQSATGDTAGAIIKYGAAMQEISSVISGLSIPNISFKGGGSGGSGSSSGSGGSGSSGSGGSGSSGSTDPDDWAKAYLDEIDNLEKRLALLKEKNASEEEIIALEKLIQSKEHTLADMARARGYSETSDFIVERQTNWWEKQNDILSQKTDAIKDVISALENQIDMLDETAVDRRTAMELEADVIEQYNKLKSTYLSAGYTESDSEVYSINKSLKEARDTLLEYLDDIVSYYEDALDGISDAYSTLKSAAKDFAAYGGITTENYTKILSLGAEYYQYLTDENGQLVINEDTIKKVTKARAEQLAVQTALTYVDKLRVATEANDVEKLNELLGVTNSVTDSTWGLVQANLAMLNLTSDQYATALDYINKIEALSLNFVGNIDDSSKSSVESTNELLDLVKEMIKQENENMIDALEAQKEAYSDLIDLKKELLEDTASEADYEKEVADQVKTVAKLQAKIAQLSLDDSREAAAQRAELEEELASALEDLNQTQSDHNLETTTDMLDDMDKAYSDEMDSQIEILKKELSSEEKLYQAAMKRIESHWSTLYSELNDYVYEYGDITINEFNKIWDAALAGAKEYNDFVSKLNSVESGDYNIVGNSQTSGGTPIQQANNYLSQMKQNSSDYLATTNKETQASLDTYNVNLAKKIASIIGQDLVRDLNGSWHIGSETGELLYTADLSKYINSETSNNNVGASVVTTNTKVSSIVQQMKNNANSWKNANTTEKARLSAENEKLAAEISNLLKQPIVLDGNGVWRIGSATGAALFNKYHSGGIVGNKGNLKQNEVLALLEENEMVLDKQKESGLFKIIDFIDVLSDRLGKAINGDLLNNIFSSSLGLRNMSTLENTPIYNNSSMVFNPQFNIEITGSNLSKNDAKTFGTNIANEAIDKLHSAFSQRGVSVSSRAKLKP